MFYVHPGVLIDPDISAPQVFIKTNGLIVEKHNILLPAQTDTSRWQVDGTNIPSSRNDPGTPDIYEIPQFTRQGGNLLEVFIDLFNVSQNDQNFRLRVLIRQGDYEDDVLFDEAGTLGSKKGERTEAFGVFVPLKLMT